MLTLDGGGVLGIYAAAQLSYLEEQLRKPLHDIVQLMVGTDTAALIALGLAAELPALQLLESLKQALPAIYDVPRIRWWRKRHYENILSEWLKSLFGSKTLNDTKIPVAIPFLDSITGRPRVWKSNHHTELYHGGNQPIWEVAFASIIPYGYRENTIMGSLKGNISGLQWANNPALVGIIESKRYFGSDLSNIFLYSIGINHLSLWQRLLNAKFSKNTQELCIAASSMAIHEQAKLLTHKDNYLRIDVDLPRIIRTSDVHEIHFLERIGRESGMRSFHQIKNLLCANST